MQVVAVLRNEEMHAFAKLAVEEVNAAATLPDGDILVLSETVLQSCVWKGDSDAAILNAADVVISCSCRSRPFFFSKEHPFPPQAKILNFVYLFWAFFFSSQIGENFCEKKQTTKKNDIFSSPHCLDLIFWNTPVS